MSGEGRDPGISPEAYRAFYEEVGDRYPEEETVYRSLRGMLRRRFIEARLKRMTGRLFDAGTGEGMYLRGYGGGKALGMDISLGKLKKARRRLPAGKSGSVGFVCADAGDCSCLRAQSFDHVLCSEVIEHVPNPSGLWRTVSRLLRPGGTALFTCPYYSGERPEWTGLGVLGEYGIGGMKGGTYYHAAYTPEELALFAGKEGLEVMETGTLEREVRPSVILPVLFLRGLDFLRRIAGRPPLGGELRDGIVGRGSLAMYRVLKYSGLLYAVLPFFPKGVRSYILVRKPS